MHTDWLALSFSMTTLSSFRRRRVAMAAKSTTPKTAAPTATPITVRADPPLVEAALLGGPMELAHFSPTSCPEQLNVGKTKHCVWFDGDRADDNSRSEPQVGVHIKGAATVLLKTDALQKVSRVPEHELGAAGSLPMRVAGDMTVT